MRYDTAPTETAPTGPALPGTALLALRRFAAESAVDARPVPGSMRSWIPGDPAGPRAEVGVTEGGLVWRWYIEVPGRRRHGRTLSLRAAWGRAARALPEMTAEQWRQAIAEGDPAPTRCGITEEIVQLFGDPDGAERTRVFVCGREPGHGGTDHAGPLLNPGGGDEEHLSAQWPADPAPADDRYARLNQARGPYRVGRKQPHNVYRQLGDEPTDDDVSLFDAIRTDLAAEAVEALNTRLAMLTQTGQADEPLGTVHASAKLIGEPCPGGCGDPRPHRVHLTAAGRAWLGYDPDTDDWVAAADIGQLTALLTESRTDRERLAEALKVCEVALHLTAVVGGTDPYDDAACGALHAGQQASGAYHTDWQPGQQERDDAGLSRCPTPCDDDCGAPCHESHDVPANRSHQPEDCPTAPSATDDDTEGTRDQ